MINHHPSEATLVAHAAGTLPVLHGCVLAVHLSVCPQCRDEVRRFEELGGAVLFALDPAPLAPDVLARAMATVAASSLNAPPPLEGLGREADQGWGEGCEQPSAFAVRTPPPILGPLRGPSPQGEGEHSTPPSLVAHFATGRWLWLGPGIRLMPLRRRDASGTRLDLIRVAPGVAMPGHGHTGAETACILQGAYADATGEYAAYDVAEGDVGLQHAPVALPGRDCVCLIATTGRLRAQTWLARLVQPLVGV